MGHLQIRGRMHYVLSRFCFSLWELIFPQKDKTGQLFLWRAEKQLLQVLHLNAEHIGSTR